MFSSNSIFLLCSLFFLVGWFPFILCLCPLFRPCEWIVWFWFVVALFFKYINPFPYLLAFAWWSYRLKPYSKKKNKSLDFLTFLPTFYDFDLLFYIFMFTLLLFIVFIITFTNRFFFFSFQICILAYLSEYFPSAISSSYIFLLLSYLEKIFQYFF